MVQFALQRYVITLVVGIFQVVEIFVVMVLESVENKQCLPTLSFIKSKLKSRLTTHLDLVVRMFSQYHYLMNIFPFGKGVA